MIPITLNSLLSIIHGKVKNESFNDVKTLYNFSIDTRTLKKRDIYIAIVGERFDGNDFIEEAFKKGASWVISSKSNYNNDRIIQVDNTNIALQNIAAFLIKTLNPKIIAITGSNGKTTTKELTGKILKNYYTNKHVLVTYGNFNNDIGMPLTILGLTKQHKYILLEMGMNHAGEIEKLCKIASPDIAVITNIGEAHIENFKSRKHLAEAKKEILKGAKNKFIAILPGVDDYYNFLKSSINTKKIITFGLGEKCNIRFLKNENTYLLGEKKVTIKNQLIGEHNINNIMAALGVAEALNIPIDISKKALERQKPIKGRLETKILVNNIILIDDTYNSNPSAMRSAIDVLAQNKMYKILVMGDMAELGVLSTKHHKDIASYILSKKIDLVLCVGEMSKMIVKIIGKNGFWFSSNNDLTVYLKKIIHKDCAILVKGSRAMKMEQIVGSIENYKVGERI